MRRDDDELAHVAAFGDRGSDDGDPGPSDEDAPTSAPLILGIAPGRPMSPHAEPQSQRAWRSPKERALSLGVRGQRMPTGFRTLDVATRGGPLSGKVIAFGGAPGAGKTTLGVQLAKHYYDAGHAVGVLASDEDADGLLIRWGQLCGHSRDALERGELTAREALAACVDQPHLLLVDQDEEDASIEQVIERLAALAIVTERPGVLLVDSMQTLRCEASSDATSPRERVDTAVRAIKAAAKVHGFLVLFTSEMARGFYRGGSQPANDPLASFKESGGIEYGVTVALAMSSVKGEPNQVDVVMPKNRLGQKLAFRLDLDRDRAAFREIERPDDEGAPEDRAAARIAAQAARVNAIATKLEHALATSLVSIVGQRALKSLVTGSNEDRQDAIAMLITTGRIEGGGKVPYRVVARSTEET